MDEEKFSKKERKLLKREQEAVERERAKRRSFMMKWLMIIGGILLVGGGFWWLIAASNQPLPGTSVADLGREHVDDGTVVKYNSNPPTSGSHYADWTRAGVFENPVSDGHLVHSLEHGYVIISYDCTKLNSKFKIQSSKLLPIVYAHEEELEAGPSASASAVLTDSVWKSKACQDLKKELSDFANSQRLWKLIVIPRPDMDRTIALTAWGRIATMDKLNKEEASQFIGAFRDMGPEKTME